MWCSLQREVQRGKGRGPADMPSPRAGSTAGLGLAWCAINRQHGGPGAALACASTGQPHTWRVVRATRVSITGPRSSLSRWTSSMMSRRTVAATLTCNGGERKAQRPSEDVGKMGAAGGHGQKLLEEEQGTWKMHRL